MKTENKCIILWVLMCLLVLSISGCGSVKKDKKEKEIHYELITTLRDSLVITHEKKEIITEKTIERVEDKKEKADNYKRTDKDGTIHEYFNYNTEIKTDEKTIENVKELQQTINILQANNTELNERLDSSEKETNKLRKQLNIYSYIFIACLVIYLVYVCYKKLKNPLLI